MEWNLMFFVNSILFGIALAMDAFSVSVANGLNEPGMRGRKVVGIAGTFGFFQLAMPLAGWFFVHTMAMLFSAFQPFIPWIALILLLFIGGKMLIEGIRADAKEDEVRLGKGTLIIQGVATSIDALSVGFTIAEYDFLAAIVESAIIGIVTFGICIAGLKLGKKLGNHLAEKAQIFGGLILIGIGAEIFIKGVFFA